MGNVVVLGDLDNLSYLSTVPTQFIDSTFTIGRIEAGSISMYTAHIDGEKLELVFTPEDFKSFEFWEDATAYEIIGLDGEIEIKLHKAVDCAVKCAVQTVKDTPEEVVLAVPEFTDGHRALAVHLGIDSNDYKAMDDILFVGEEYEISVFTHGRKRYNVCRDSVDMPTDSVVELDSSKWKVTTKYILKITKLRTPAAFNNEGWKSYVGRVFEYSGNTYVGVKVHCDDERIDLMHFYLKYIV